MSLVSHTPTQLPARPLGMPTEVAPPALRARWFSNAERRETRVRLAAQDVRGVFDNRIPFRVVDVSEGGMCIETDRPLPYDDGVTVRFDDSGLVFTVRVAWAKLVQGGAAGPRYRAGMQFLEPTFDQIRALLELAAA